MTWINRIAVYPHQTISTGPLPVKEWLSAIKRLRQRGTIPNINPLQTKSDSTQSDGPEAQPQPGNITELTTPSGGPTLLPEETPSDDPDESEHISAQEDLVRATHLRSRPLSLENSTAAQVPVSSVSRPMNRDNYPINPKNLLNNSNRL